MSYLVKLTIILLIFRNTLCSEILIRDNNTDCTFISSYITFGDFFDAINNSTKNNVKTDSKGHYWTIGVVSKGNCNKSPEIALFNTSNDQNDKLYIKPWLQNFYKPKTQNDAFFNQKCLNKNTIVRQSFHYQINGEHLKKYDSWQVVINETLTGELYKLPNIKKYLQKSKLETYNNLNVFLISDIKLFDDDNDISTLVKMHESIDEVDIFMHLSNFGEEAIECNVDDIDVLFTTLTKPLSSKPYLLSPSYKVNKQETFKMLNFRFRMPGGNDNVQTRNNWYSCKINDVYFVTLNHNYHLTSSNDYVRKECYSWLSLQMNLATDSKYKVFFSHQPTFCSDVTNSSCNY